MKLSVIIRKRYLILLIAALLIIIYVCTLDARQQRTFKELRYGYEEMKAENYKAASEIFRNYLDSHSASSLYWKMIEKVNGGDDPFTYNNVREALSECESCLS